MKIVLKVLAVAALMSAVGCSTMVPVVVPAIEVPFPAQAMESCPSLEELASTTPQELKLWIAKAASDYGLCAARRKELADYIVRNRK